ncbi:hypothetical protein A9Q81_08045 [Gammaproteobacteria bacterium 42_54_T18]|nr:hypothetical protein A9Q81_08045 [Gammaproteobacteria bacterium 42_54_T18]
MAQPTIKITLIYASLCTPLLLQGCGGSATTPTLWEIPFIDTPTPTLELKKSGTDTLSRLAYNSNTLNIQNFNLNGVLIAENNTPLDVGNKAGVIQAYKGHIWSNSYYINMVKFDQNWNAEWNYQLTSTDGYQRYNSLSVSPFSDKVIISTTNEAGSPIIIMLNNGTESFRYTSDNPEITSIRFLTFSGEHIYAYGVKNASPSNGVLFVFNHQLEKFQVSDDMNIDKIIASPNGIIIGAENTLTAFDSNLAQQWELSSPNNLSTTRLIEGDQHFYLYEEKNQELAASYYYAASSTVESYSYDGSFEWEYRAQRTGYRTDFQNTTIEEIDSENIVLTYKQDISSLPDLTDALMTRHSVNIKHHVLNNKGELSRLITENTYRYDETACLGGWGFCIPASIFIEEGITVNYGVLIGSNNEILTLSHLGKGIETESHSVLTAY